MKKGSKKKGRGRRLPSGIDTQRRKCMFVRQLDF